MVQAVRRSRRERAASLNLARNAAAVPTRDRNSRTAMNCVVQSGGSHDEDNAPGVNAEGYAVHGVKPAAAHPNCLGEGGQAGDGHAHGDPDQQQDQDDGQEGVPEDVRVVFHEPVRGDGIHRRVGFDLERNVACVGALPDRDAEEVRGSRKLEDAFGVGDREGGMVSPIRTFCCDHPCGSPDVVLLVVGDDVQVRCPCPLALMRKRDASGVERFGAGNAGNTGGENPDGRGSTDGVWNISVAPVWVTQ
jgi:hypothetical protein